MKVLSGTIKGRKLVSPPGLELRPTPNKVRAALYDILARKILDASFLDLYAGTGAIGIEALSRGAKLSCFVESNQKHLRCLKKNIAQCSFATSSFVFGTSVFDFLTSSKQVFDIVFLDPPYSSDEIEKILPRLILGDMIAENGLIVVEHFHKKDLSKKIGDTDLLKFYRYGETVLSFYGRS